MNQSDLEQLPPEQRRRAMLTIAIGRDAKDYYHEYVNGSLILTEPQNDGALMWKLMGVLRDCLRAGFGYHGGNDSLVMALDSADDLIDAFIEEDPLRNIGKWKQMQRFKV